MVQTSRETTIIPVPFVLRTRAHVDVQLIMPRTRCSPQRASDCRRVPPGIYICYNASAPRRWRTARRLAAATGIAASHKTLSCNVQLQSPEARLQAPINGLVRVDGIDDVPPGLEPSSGARPRCVRVRLARAWDSLTSARPSQRQLLFDSFPTPIWT